jgi:hypothetical protein
LKGGLPLSKTPLTGVISALALLLAVATSSSANSAVGGFGEAATAADTERPTMDFSHAGSKAADLPLDSVSGEATQPLPLSQVAGGSVATPASAPMSLGDLINQIRYGGLPEPASWALMLIGFGMIGGALRGFMIANRRLAGLQPEEAEDRDASEDDL